MKRFILLFFAVPAFAQLSTPTFSLPSGTSQPNMVWVLISSPQSGTTICYTLDGTTPTAATPGTCDSNGSIFSGPAAGQYGAAEFNASGTLKAIATEAAQTNSSVATANYTVTTSSALYTLGFTPVQQVTSAATNTLYTYPWLLLAPNGKIFMWYTAPNNQDSGLSGMLLLNTSIDGGATWQGYAPNHVKHIVMTNFGSGYTSASCSMTGNATCTANIRNGAIPSLTLNSGGSGYNYAFQGPNYGTTNHITCAITGGGTPTTTATCLCLLNLQTDSAIQQVILTDPGAGYSSTPTVTCTGMGGSPTNASVTAGAPTNGLIVASVVGLGSGYAGSAPSVTISGNGSNAAGTALLNDCHIGDPSNCFWHDYNRYTELEGGGVTTNGSIVVNSTDFDMGYGGNYGMMTFRSTDNGDTWSLTNQSGIIGYGPANLISIPAGSVGVTGSCASGCQIQRVWVYQQSSSNALIFSYDDGQTWSAPSLIPAFNGSVPGEADESVLAWPGAMQLISFTRSVRAGSTNLGWPAPILVNTTPDLGATWTFNPSNLTTGPCSVTPSLSWSDDFTHPSIVTNPLNSAQSTVIWGERLSCTGQTPGIRWTTFTFNTLDAYTNKGTDIPARQVLNLNPGGTNFNHTSYSGSAIRNGNSIVMAWEQGQTSSTEDIFTTTLAFPQTNPILVSGAVTFSNSVTIK